MDYQCKFCNKCYKSNSSLWNHNKKFHKEKSDGPSAFAKHTSAQNAYHEKVMVIKSYKCRKCNMEFKHYQSRWRHEVNCNSSDIQLKEIKDEIKELKDIVKNSQKVNISNYINTGTAINNNFNINTFNNDNLSFLTEGFITNILKDLKIEDEHYLIIPKVLNEVKFNKDHPENHNIIISSFRSKYGRALSDKGWVYVEANELVEKLAHRGFQIFKKISNENPDKMNGIIPECFQDFKDNFLTGSLKDDIKTKVKEVAVIGSKNINNNKTLIELEDEADKEIEL